MRSQLSPYALSRSEVLSLSRPQEAPFVMDKEKAHTSEEQYEGFCIDLAKELAQIVGFNYRFQLVFDGNYGSRNAQGEWDGMVKELIDGVGRSCLW